jgi:REP element-mobilizing transposase RayT
MLIRHGKNLRTGRRSISGQIYLVTAGSFKRQSLFADQRIGKLVADEFLYSDQLEHTSSLAYVVMPDHIHWLFQISGDQQLSYIMQMVKGRSARRISRELEGMRHVWQPGFHDRAIRRYEDLEVVANYVVHNPVRAGLVEDIYDYPLWWLLNRS